MGRYNMLTIPFINKTFFGFPLLSRLLFSPSPWSGDCTLLSLPNLHFPTSQWNNLLCLLVRKNKRHESLCYFLSELCLPQCVPNTLQYDKSNLRPFREIKISKYVQNLVGSAFFLESWFSKLGAIRLTEISLSGYNYSLNHIPEVRSSLWYYVVVSSYELVSFKCSTVVMLQVLYVSVQLVSCRMSIIFVASSGKKVLILNLIVVNRRRFYLLVTHFRV